MDDKSELCVWHDFGHNSSDNSHGATKALTVYEQHAHVIAAEIRSSLVGIKDAFYARVTEFVRSAGPGKGLVPAAAVEFGLNLADREDQLEELKRRLSGVILAPKYFEDGKRPVVAVRLGVHSCTSIKRALRQLINGLKEGIKGRHRNSRLDSEDLEASVFERIRIDDDEEEEVEEKATDWDSQTFHSLRQFTLQLTESGLSPLLLVMLEELEAFPAPILSDLLHMLHLNRQLGLQVSVVLGLGTAEFAVTEKLRQETVALLRIRSFLAPSPHRCLNVALSAAERGMSTREHPLWLSAGLLKQLRRDFEQNHYSTVELTHLLRFAILQHCLEQEPLLDICLVPELCQEAVESLPESTLRLASEFKALKGRGLRESVFEAVQEFQDYQSGRSALVSCLWRLVSPLPDRGWQSEGALDEALRCPGFFDSDGWSTTLRLAAAMDRESLETLVSDLIGILQSNAVHANRCILSDMLRFADKLSRLDELQAALDDKENAAPKTVTPTAKKRLSRFDHQEMLRAQLDNRKSASALHQERSRLLRYLSSQFQSRLRCPDELALSSLFLVPAAPNELALRRQTQLALLNNPDNDTSVLFRLYRTISTKTVPIAKLQELFVAEAIRGSRIQTLEVGNEKEVQPPTPPKRGRKSLKAESGKDVGARFYVALAELEFFGILKGMERRSTHVQRLFGVDEDLLEDELAMEDGED